MRTIIVDTITVESSGTRNSGRVAGLLELEVSAGRMTVGQAELAAQLGFGLDADEVDDCVERLRTYAAEPFLHD